MCRQGAEDEETHRAVSQIQIFVYIRKNAVEWMNLCLCMRVCDYDKKEREREATKWS